MTIAARRYCLHLQETFRHDNVYGLSIYEMTTESGNYFPKRLNERADLDGAYCGGCKKTN
jgi:hypothetical protein